VMTPVRMSEGISRRGFRTTSFCGVSGMIFTHDEDRHLDKNFLSV
jgi:hypothetical protein